MVSRARQNFPFLRVVSTVPDIAAGASAPHQIDVENLHIKQMSVNTESECSQHVLSYGASHSWTTAIVVIPGKGLGGKGQNAWTFSGQLYASAAQPNQAEQLMIAVTRQSQESSQDHLGPFPQRVNVL
jgi:hypothetical protein